MQKENITELLEIMAPLRRRKKDMTLSNTSNIVIS